MTSSQDRTIDIRHYWRLLWRRKGIILLCVASVLCAAFITLMFVRNVYESEVTLMIEDSQTLSKQVEGLMGGIMQAPTGYRVDEDRMGKLVGRIRSRPFLERVIRMLRMYEDPIVRQMAERRCKSHPEVSPEEMAVRILVENLQSRIQFAPAGAGIFKVIVADYSAENAQMLAKWISELYVDVSGEQTLDRLLAGHEFTVEQLRVYEDQLQRAEDALERYKQSAIEQSLRMVLVKGDNLALAEPLYQRVVDEASLAQLRLNSDARTLNQLGIGIERIDPLEDSGVRDLARGLTTALRNAVAERLAGTAINVNDWPPSGVYSSFRRDLLKLTETAADGALPDAGTEVRAAAARYLLSKVDLEAQQATVQWLGGAIDAFKRQVGLSVERDIELARLERKVEQSRQLLESFQAQSVAGDVRRDVETTKLGVQIEILDPARLPLEPSRPNRVKILLAALFLGVVLGAGFAFVSETLDHVLRSLEDFERIVPEPILGTTPLLTRRLVDRRSWAKRHWIALVLAAVVTVTLAVFVARSSLLMRFATQGVPVKIVNPERLSDENPR